MNDFRLAYSGFDTFNAAFQGALAADLLPVLLAAKEDAQRRNEPHLLTIGPAGVEAHVSDRGMRGGYALQLSTGPVGANFWVKDDLRQGEWNLFAASRAEALLSRGFRQYWQYLGDTLRGMGATVGRESINRLDFAMDFVTRGFSLVPEQFVAPARTIKSVELAEGKASNDPTPKILIAGRDVESVTIGRMPGRQVIVYNKRAEALKFGKLYWFEQWGVDPRDPDVQVFRVELRAGKHHLKEDWGLATYQDLEDFAGDVFLEMAAAVRYIEPLGPGENITRAALHPLWHAVRAALGNVLADHRSGVTPGRIIEIERAHKLRMSIDNIAGNAASFAVAKGTKFEDAFPSLPDEVRKALRERFDEDPEKLAKKMDEVEDRHRFIVPKV